MNMRARVIYNPTSGKELAKKNLADILNILEEAGFEASAYATTPVPFSARDEAQRVARAGFDLIVAVGGDGTINEVVNGIAPLPKRPKMAIIPAGTTNDYARALKIPRDNILKAAEVILKKQMLKIDIGQANDRYFINIGAGGYLTELTYGVPSQIKSVFGYLAYFAKGAEMLPKVKPIKMHLVYDEGEYTGEASMFFLSLTNSVGGFEQIAPDSQLDDGKFSLIIVKTANVVEIVHLFALMQNGAKHINDPRIIYTKTSKLFVNVLDETEEMMINIDGEHGGDTPITFTNLKQHIEMFANLDEIDEKAMSMDSEQYEHLTSEFEKELADDHLNSDEKQTSYTDKE